MELSACCTEMKAFGNKTAQQHCSASVSTRRSFRLHNCRETLLGRMICHRNEKMSAYIHVCPNIASLRCLIVDFLAVLFRYAAFYSWIFAFRQYMYMLPYCSRLPKLQLLLFFPTHMPVKDDSWIQTLDDCTAASAFS